MTVENISWSNLHERMLQTWLESNPHPPDHRSDARPIESPRHAGLDPATFSATVKCSNYLPTHSASLFTDNLSNCKY